MQTMPNSGNVCIDRLLGGPTWEFKVLVLVERRKKESNICQSLSSKTTERQGSVNKVGLLTSKVVELSFIPEPEL